MDQLKLVIVGHVDHGKSTFVGRLLHDTDSLPDGKYEQIKQSCEKRGVEFEYAFLMDAFEAERDQNVTIDTAQIWFKTKKRQYVIIDAPGHKEFIKNMVTGAAQADAAILMIDANEGVREQSKRHGTLLSMLGIKQVLVVVNKMDLVGYDREVFQNIRKEYTQFLNNLNIDPLNFIPISARNGDNVAKETENLSWFKGTVLEQIDEFVPTMTFENSDLRFPVQDVYRFDERRIIAGRVESGKIKVGDVLFFYPSGRSNRVKTIEGWAQESINEIASGYSAGITLEDQIFVERGNIAVHSEDSVISSKRLKARVFWLGKDPLVKNKKYKIKLATQESECEVVDILKITDSSTLKDREADQIEQNDVAEIIIESKTLLAFDNYESNVVCGRIVIVDNKNVSGGGVLFGNEKIDQEHVSKNIHHDLGYVSTEYREKKLNQKGAVLWFTGLSGSGKSTIANALEKGLMDYYSIHAKKIDGDNLRFGLNKDLGFSPEDRKENIRRAAEVCSILADTSIVAIASFISPYKKDRDMARKIAENNNQKFFEIYINTPLEVCEKRDPKGLYQKARNGEIKGFTGIDSPYEPPANPEILIDAVELELHECVEKIFEKIIPAIRHNI